MRNCWISCQVLADVKKIYYDLIIINMYWVISKQCGRHFSNFMVFSQYLNFMLPFHQGQQIFIKDHIKEPFRLDNMIYKGLYFLNFRSFFAICRRSKIEYVVTCTNRVTSKFKGENFFQKVHNSHTRSVFIPIMSLDYKLTIFFLVNVKWKNDNVKFHR